jgi:hypothetical protein
MGPGDRLARVTAAADPRIAFTYTYDPVGRLIRAAAGGVGVRFEYLETTQQITKLTDDAGKVLFAIEYDDVGWVIREQDFLGLTDGESRTFSYERRSTEGVVATVVFPPSLAEPSWHPVKVARMDVQSRLTELLIQPTSRRIYIGRYEYDSANRRIPLERPCSEVVAEEGRG